MHQRYSPLFVSAYGRLSFIVVDRYAPNPAKLYIVEGVCEGVSSKYVSYPNNEQERFMMKESKLLY